MYDVELRRRTVISNLDPGVFHYTLWEEMQTIWMTDQVVERLHSEGAVTTSTSNYPQSDSYSSFNRQTAHTSRFQPYPKDSRNRTYPSHRFQEQSANQNHDEFKGKCFFCGDATSLHSLRNCYAQLMVNGQPCHLRKLGSEKFRKDKDGHSYCFLFNGFAGCSNGSTCPRGKHWCSLCGSRSHNAQSCSIGDAR